MIENAPSAALPEHVLRRADVQEALSCRDFGQVFFLARKWGGISYTKIAESCGIKTDRVGSLAKGRGSITSFEKIVQIADGMRIPGRYLGIIPRFWERPRAESSGQDTESIGSAEPFPAQARKRAQAGSWETPEQSAPAGDTAVLPSAAELRDSERGSARFLRELDAAGPGETVIAQLYAELRSVSQRYLREPTRPLLAELCTLRDEARSLLDLRSRTRQRRDLLVVIGWSTALMGWISVDMGRADLAGTHARAARWCAEEAEHDGVRAWVCKVEQMAAYWAQHRVRAAQYAEYGSVYAMRTGGGAAAITLSTLALDYARLGRQADALDAVRRACQAVEGAVASEDSDLGGPLRCPPERARGYWANTYLVLGRPEAAITLVERAITESESASPPLRNLGTERMMRLHLVVGHLLGRDLEAAAQALRPVLETPPGLRVEPLVLRAKEICALLPAGRGGADMRASVIDFTRPR